MDTGEHTRLAGEVMHQPMRQPVHQPVRGVGGANKQTAEHMVASSLCLLFYIFMDGL